LSRFATTLESAGGSIEHETIIQEIDYHGVLGQARADRLLEAARTGQVSWLATEGVRLFHATGQMAVPGEDDEERASGPDRLGRLPTGRSRIAILDGLPVAGHEALDGRLRIDDPENWGDTVSVASRNHGTLMASLVVHGDLGDAPQSLEEPSGPKRPPRSRTPHKSCLRSGFRLAWSTKRLRGCSRETTPPPPALAWSSWLGAAACSGPGAAA
jgi:hypothetical protein